MKGFDITFRWPARTIRQRDADRDIHLDILCSVSNRPNQFQQFPPSPTPTLGHRKRSRAVDPQLHRSLEPVTLSVPRLPSPVSTLQFFQDIPEEK